MSRTRKGSILGHDIDGCIRIGDLDYQSLCKIPKKPEIYAVLCPTEQRPSFLRKNPAGHFKGKAPSLTESELKRKWVQDTRILYIGKAGGELVLSTLRTRIISMISFGLGVPVGHWGGRLIWQLKNHESLEIYWKTTPRKNPRELEKKLLLEFKRQFSMLPFANWLT